MDKQFPTAWVLVVSFLTAYFLIGTLLTEDAVLPTGVLFLVLVLWFSVYRFQCGNLKTRELVTKMYADLKGALEEIKERMAQTEAQKRTAEEREKHARLERERRRANRPTRDPAVDRYAGMIENRVRESERTRQDSEEL